MFYYLIKGIIITGCLIYLGIMNRLAIIFGLLTAVLLATFDHLKTNLKPERLARGSFESDNNYGCSIGFGGYNLETFQSEGPGSERPGSERSGSERPGSERPGSERPRNSISEERSDTGLPPASTAQPSTLGLPVTPLFMSGPMASPHQPASPSITTSPTATALLTTTPLLAGTPTMTQVPLGVCQVGPGVGNTSCRYSIATTDEQKRKYLCLNEQGQCVAKEICLVHHHMDGNLSDTVTCSLNPLVTELPPGQYCQLFQNEDTVQCHLMGTTLLTGVPANQRRIP